MDYLSYTDWSSALEPLKKSPEGFNRPLISSLFSFNYPPESNVALELFDQSNSLEDEFLNLRIKIVMF